MPKKRTLRTPDMRKTDIEIGRRVRLARVESGLTQAAFGSAVGLTFQQIQKYERGANRISCSMLSAMAPVLRKPITYFFDEGEPSPELNTRDLGDRLLIELHKAARQTDDRELILQVTRLLRAKARPKARKQ